MNYQNIKLDKSMYKQEEGFAAYLESLDPAEQYAGSPLGKLDAFERQLHRFGIKVKGAGSSQIAKFFSTAQGAALFPEYVTRAVAQGARESSILNGIIASHTDISATDYRSITTDIDDADLSDTIAEGAAIPTTGIALGGELVKLKKRGRMLEASYEAIRFQRLDVFTVALQQIGNHIAKAQLKDAVEVLLSRSPETVELAGTALCYEDLLGLWGLFEDFDMTVLLASPDMALEILAIEEIRDPVRGLHFQETGGIATPLGATLVKSGAVPEGTVIALDKRFALEMVTAGGVQVEYDKLIDSQLERAAVTCICGFNKIFDKAVKVLEKPGA